MTLVMNRVWAMPSPHTFTIKPIAELLARFPIRESCWADPFAGFHSPAHVTNDLNPEAPTTAHTDALEWLSSFPDSKFDGVLYDPPYSYRQASEVYKKFGREKLSGAVTNSGYWSRCKRAIARIVRPGGIVISCGWNSGGVGMSNGFQLEEVLLVPHGGDHQDTIATVERKL